MTAPVGAAPEPSEPFRSEVVSHLDAVARFAHWLTRNAADADDLVQETYLRALRAWRTFTPGTDAKRWLLTICRNTFVSARRRSRREYQLDTPELEAIAATTEYETAATLGLDRLFERQDLGEAIQREVHALPDAYREVVVLVDLEGFAYAETAEVLAMPIGTVRSRLFRARRLLQQRLVHQARDAGLVGPTQPGDRAAQRPGGAHA